jgi:hypothetical protein
MAAPVDEALQLAYPDVYDLADSSGPWGSQEQGKVGGTAGAAALHGALDQPGTAQQVAGWHCRPGLERATWAIKHMHLHKR